MRNGTARVCSVVVLCSILMRDHVDVRGSTLIMASEDGVKVGDAVRVNRGDAAEESGVLVSQSVGKNI